MKFHVGKLAIIPLQAHLFFLMLLPASGFIEIKILLTFLSIAAIPVAVTRSNAKVVGLVFSIAGAFFVLTLALVNGFILSGNYDLNLRAYTSYIGFFLSLFLMQIYFLSGSISMSQFIRPVLAGALIFCAEKIFLLSLVASGFLSAGELRDLVAQYVGSVTFEFWSEDSRFPRIAVGNDIVLPFIFAFLLNGDDKVLGISGRLKSISLFVIFVCSLLSFSRIVWVIDLFVTAFYFLGSRKKIFLGVAFGAVIISLSLFLYMNRLTSETAVARSTDIESIRVKNSQIGPLFRKFSENPVLGNGLGAYAPEIIRSPYQPYIYETQWVALLMQVGIFGVAAILVFYAWNIGNELVVVRKVGKIRDVIYLICLSLLWLMTGFTNPYLFVMCSSIVVFLIFNFHRSWMLLGNPSRERQVRS